MEYFVLNFQGKKTKDKEKDKEPKPKREKNKESKQKKKKKNTKPTPKQMKNIDLLHQHTQDTLLQMEKEQKKNIYNFQVSILTSSGLRPTGTIFGWIKCDSGYLVF